MFEGSLVLEVKLPTGWTHGKAEVGKSEKRREEERRSEKRQSEERRSRCARGRKVAITFIIPMICGPGGSKSRLVGAAGAQPSFQMRHEQLRTVVARSTFPSKKC